MENASKALIMAGAILIALIIISLGMLIFTNMRSSVTSNSSLTEQEISNFNSKITPYLGENVSGSQVNALIERVRSVNQSVMQEEDVEEGIMQITYPSSSGNVILTVKNELNPSTGSRKVETGVYYTVEATYDGNTGLITTIVVTKN